MSAAVTSLIPSFLAFLAQYGSYDATPIIGTVFPNKSVQLPGFLEASNTDELIHDLAVLVSHRGIVFFRDQDITIEQHKSLGQSLPESLQQINYIGTLFLKMSQSWVVKSPSFPPRGMP